METHFDSSFSTFMWWWKPLPSLLFRSALFCVVFSMFAVFLLFHAVSCGKRFNWILCNTLFYSLLMSFSLDFSISFPFWFLHYSAFGLSVYRLYSCPTVKLNWAKLSAELIEMWETRSKVNGKVNFCLTLVLLRKRLKVRDKKSFKNFSFVSAIPNN